MQVSDASVNSYLAELPDEIRHDMVSLDAVIGDVMAGLLRELWVGRFWGGTDQTIVGYGRMESPRSDGSTVDWFMVGLARQKRHFSVYINAVEDRQYLSEKYGSSIGRSGTSKIKVGKSSLGFASVDDIDLDVLADLVQRARSILE